VDIHDLREHQDTQIDRRRIVKTGVKLAYAAPLVAASFRLTSSGALAVACEDYEFPLNNRCCTCDGCTVGEEPYFDAAAGVCKQLKLTPGQPDQTFICGEPTCRVVS